MIHKIKVPVKSTRNHKQVQDKRISIRNKYNEWHICWANSIHTEIQTWAKKRQWSKALFSNPSPETTIVTQNKSATEFERKQGVAERPKKRESKEKKGKNVKKISSSVFDILWLAMFHSAQDRETISAALKLASIEWNAPGLTKDSGWTMLNVGGKTQRAGTGQLTVVPWLLQQGLSPGSVVVTCHLPRICAGWLPNQVSSTVKRDFKLPYKTLKLPKQKILFHKKDFCQALYIMMALIVDQKYICYQQVIVIAVPSR